MTEFSENSIKNHGLFLGKLAMTQLLSIFLGWAAFPLFFLLFARYMSINTPMSIYSVIACIINALMLMGIGNEYGLLDRKPYKWAKYKGKGAAIGAVLGIAIFLLELLVILIANRVMRVSHPQFNIENVNNYMRLLLYSPFYWFFELLSTGDIENGLVQIPRVEVWSSLVYIPFIAIFSELGYELGINGIDIDFKLKRKKEQ